MALVEIACGPLNELQMTQEIPFVCSLFTNQGNADIGVMYGVDCRIDVDQLWQEFKIPAFSLPEWIGHSMETGIYRPGKSDIIISDGTRLEATLCHESDLHIKTSEKAIIHACVGRWLSSGYRLLQTDDESSPDSKKWREIRSISDAMEEI